MTGRKEFDRAKSPYARSLVGYRFRTDAATINSYLWVGLLAEKGLEFAVRPLAGEDDPLTALTLPSETYKGRLGHDVDELKKRMVTHSRWRRLLTLVMVSSAFERFVLDIAGLAIAADPLLEPGFPKVLDGALLRKHGRTLPARDLQVLTVGEWTQRIAGYKRLFGDVPPELNSALGDLEDLRKIRNRVAHALGVDGAAGSAERTLSVLEVTIQSRLPELSATVAISDTRLTALLGVVQRCVDSIDSHLLTQHIGSFELVSMYLEWSENPDKFEARAGLTIKGYKRSEHDRFNNVLGGIFGGTPGAHYVKALKTFAAEIA